jgi:hypothetical protein
MDIGTDESSFIPLSSLVSTLKKSSSPMAGVKDKRQVSKETATCVDAKRTHKNLRMSACLYKPDEK